MQYGGMPELLGPRVLLRAPRVEDAEDLFASVTSDPEVTEYLSWTPHTDIGETRRVIRELFNVGDDRTWVVVLRDTDEIVGQLGYRRPQRHAAEMGYCMAARWWGRGLMPEAVGVALQRLQQDSQLYRVTAASTWTTRGRPECSRSADSCWKAGSHVTPCSQIWVPSRRTASHTRGC